jgi:iron complex transport system permease protein
MTTGTLQPQAGSGASLDRLLAVRYARLFRRRLLILAGLAAALVCALLLDVATGPSTFPLSDVLRGLVDRDALPVAQAVILWDIRLPYALMAVAVGACLALAGAELQTILNNPLASPFTLGISQAAALGASVAIVLSAVATELPGGPVPYMMPLFAFATAFGAALLIHWLARAYGAGTGPIVLFGIALFFLCNALVSLLQFVENADVVQQIVFWIIGSLSRATWPKVTIVALAFAIAAPFAFRNAWAMTLLAAGEAQALSVGVPVGRLRLMALLRVSFLSAVAISFVGAIGFVGLVGPHMARLALGEDHRLFLPGAALCGAVLMSLASIASKLVVPGLIVPVGIVTALIGVPLFMALVLSRRRAL